MTPGSTRYERRWVPGRPPATPRIRKRSRRKRLRLAPASLFTHVMVGDTRAPRERWSPHRTSTREVRKALLQGQHQVTRPLSLTERLSRYLPQSGRLTPRQARRARQKNRNTEEFGLGMNNVVWRDEFS